MHHAVWCNMKDSEGMKDVEETDIGVPDAVV